MSLDAICKFFQIEADYKINAPAPASPIIHAKNHEEAILQIYNPVEDSTRLKNQPEQFGNLTRGLSFAARRNSLFNQVLGIKY